MMKEFARPKSQITCLCKTGLQGLDFGIIDKIVGTLIASSAGGELPGKNCCSAGGAEYSGGVCVTEVDSSFCEHVDVRCDRPRSISETTDPVIHVVDREKQDVWFFLGEIRKGNKA